MQKKAAYGLLFCCLEFTGRLARASLNEAACFLNWPAMKD
jgi:hypothetical protein